MTGLANIFFLSSRLRARLYWRKVSVRTDLALCATDGAEPLTQLRLTSALVSLRNPLPQGERGPPGSLAGGKSWRDLAMQPPCQSFRLPPPRAGEDLRYVAFSNIGFK
jgi:hypothetical protein